MAPKIFYILSYMFFLSLVIAHPSHSNLHHHFNDEESSSSSPFQFLKGLHGSVVKGDNVEGLNKLKFYLKTFGYLRNQTYRDNNIFDNELENAIKDYQRFYGLNVTGRLDDSTVALMMMPRCGVTDGSTTMLHQRGGPGSPQFGPDYAFFHGKPRWTTKRNFTYSFQPISRADDVVLPPIARAFKKWSVQTPLGFTFTYTKDYNAADLKLSFQRREHGDGKPFDGKYGVIAHAFAPQDGRAHFDVEEDWFFGEGAWNVPGNKMDMQTVSMHEIGHLLGLEHSRDENAIMYPIIKYGTSRTVTEDDIKGLIMLYISN